MWGSKVLGRFRNMYVDSLACVEVKVNESHRFRVDSGMKQGCHIPLAFQCIYGCSDDGNRKE